MSSGRAGPDDLLAGCKLTAEESSKGLQDLSTETENKLGEPCPAVNQTSGDQQDLAKLVSQVWARLKAGLLSTTTKKEQHKPGPELLVRQQAQILCVLWYMKKVQPGATAAAPMQSNPALFWQLYNHAESELRLWLNLATEHAVKIDFPILPFPQKSGKGQSSLEFIRENVQFQKFLHLKRVIARIKPGRFTEQAKFELEELQTDAARLSGDSPFLLPAIDGLDHVFADASWWATCCRFNVEVNQSLDGTMLVFPFARAAIARLVRAHSENKQLQLSWLNSAIQALANLKPLTGLEVSLTKKPRRGVRREWPPAERMWLSSQVVQDALWRQSSQSCALYGEGFAQEPLNPQRGLDVLCQWATSTLPSGTPPTNELDRVLGPRASAGQQQLKDIIEQLASASDSPLDAWSSRQKQLPRTLAAPLVALWAGVFACFWVVGRLQRQQRMDAPSPPSSPPPRVRVPSPPPPFVLLSPLGSPPRSPPLSLLGREEVDSLLGKDDNLDGDALLGSFPPRSPCFGDPVTGVQDVFSPFLDFPPLEAEPPADFKSAGAPASKKAKTSIHAKPYKCSSCTSKFSHASSLKSHVTALHSGDCLYVCKQPGCGKSFSTAWALERHLKVMPHTPRPTVGGPPPPSQPATVCPHCHAQLKHRSSLRAHLRIHEKVKPFHCEICDRRFTQKATLLDHMNTKHTDQRSFVCPEKGCLKAFALRRALREHKLRKHTSLLPVLPSTLPTPLPIPPPQQGEPVSLAPLQIPSSPAWIYPWQESPPAPAPSFGYGNDYTLSDDDDDNKDIVPAGSDRPYVCTVPGCNSSFSKKFNLQRHLRSLYHTERAVGKRPVVCPRQGCSKAFASSQALRRHEQRIHAALAPTPPHPPFEDQ